MKEDSSTCTKEDEIAQIEAQGPHVVILGAGASLATCPNGDGYGKELPVMKNFVKTLNLSGILKKANIDLRQRNFEKIYDRICKDKKQSYTRKELEKAIYNYFASMRLPDSPTIYDHLILSLRGKDVIATFNWDPLLIQAYRRNSGKFNLPRLLFLHGNVTIGYCEKDHTLGVNGNTCTKCGRKFVSSKILYPIQNKNYHKDKFISGQWKELIYLMNHAFMLTIFGYGAPISDVSAVELLKQAWGDKVKRSMEQTEIIDVRNSDDLRITWKPFMHTHHYEIHNDFYNSWIANHPRRTGEAYLNQYYKAKFIENNPIPRSVPFPELWGWLDKLHEVEAKYNQQKT